MSHNRPASLRITNGFDRGAPVRILVDGETIPAFEGESVASALLAAGRLKLRVSPGGNPRGAFCLIGMCQECVVEHDGQVKAACQLPCAEGLSVSLRDFSDAGH